MSEKYIRKQINYCKKKKRKAIVLKEKLKKIKKEKKSQIKKIKDEIKALQTNLYSVRRTKIFIKRYLIGLRYKF